MDGGYTYDITLYSLPFPPELLALSLSQHVSPLLLAVCMCMCASVGPVCLPVFLSESVSESIGCMSLMTGPLREQRRSRRSAAGPSASGPPLVPSTVLLLTSQVPDPHGPPSAQFLTLQPICLLAHPYPPSHCDDLPAVASTRSIYPSAVCLFRRRATGLQLGGLVVCDLPPRCGRYSCGRHRGFKPAGRRMHSRGTAAHPATAIRQPPGSR